MAGMKDGMYVRQSGTRPVCKQGEGWARWPKSGDTSFRPSIFAGTFVHAGGTQEDGRRNIP